MAVTLKGASAELLGSSTDDKPTDVPVNTLFTELDTNTVYYFDGEEWQTVGSGSGGGDGNITA